MRKTIILLFISLILCANKAFSQIDVVYPKSTQFKVNTSSIFFIGNTDLDSKFYVNNQPVKLWENNFFVHTQPLKVGDNKIVLKSISNGRTEEKIYNIKRQDRKWGKAPVHKIYQLNNVLCAKTNNNNSTLREKPTKNSKRIMELPKNVNLYLTAKSGEYYKIQKGGEQEFWIHQNNLEKPSVLSKTREQKLIKVSTDSDSSYNYKKYKLEYPSLYTIKQISDCNLEVIIYGSKMTMNQNIVLPYTILGYDSYYEGNTLIVRTQKIPKIKNENNPLKDITIFVDAGHGGKESGAIGPTRVYEKEINLAIAKFLIEDLQKDGANVFYSRCDDVKIPLYDRKDIAKYSDSFISISIHNNSLPNGKDPYVNHGVEVHYYNDNAKQLAQIIQKNLVNDLKIKDNNIRKSSFVMTRSTLPISVLVECAYMIHPEEYILLKNPKFQKKIAETIKKSINEYIFLITAKKM